ncbi:MAG: AAA family ATPase, partial [Spirochaetes bacterium]|nr:AAA family ATPase [Spirochaetota bacterium]
MIQSIQFHSGYPTKLDGIRTAAITFNARINLVIGPNGSGKSTVLAALAKAGGCGDGGWSDPNVPTDPASVSGHDRRYRAAAYEVLVTKDEWPVFYQDCYGDSEHSFLDPDYLESKSMLRSTGEKRVGLINELIDHIEDRFPTFRLKRHDRPTLLLDEVDNHVGFAGQAILWQNIIPKLSKKYQLILSTHSIFPLLLRRDNPSRQDKLIELSEGYATICVEELHRAVRY